MGVAAGRTRAAAVIAIDGPSGSGKSTIAAIKKEKEKKI
jgi:cytidylate kinase